LSETIRFEIEEMAEARQPSLAHSKSII